MEDDVFDKELEDFFKEMDEGIDLRIKGVSLYKEDKLEEAIEAFNDSLKLWKDTHTWVWLSLALLKHANKADLGIPGFSEAFQAAEIAHRRYKAEQEDFLEEYGAEAAHEHISTLKAYHITLYVMGEAKFKAFGDKDYTLNIRKKLLKFDPKLAEKLHKIIFP